MSESAENQQPTENLLDKKTILELKKLRLETQKVSAEIRELTKPFYTKSSFWLQSLGMLISILVPIGIIGIGYCKLGGKELLDVKRERLELQKEKLDKSISAFKADSVKLSKEVRNLRDTASFLSNRVGVLNGEKQLLEKQNAWKSAQLQVKDKALEAKEEMLKDAKEKIKLAKLYTAIEYMDSIGWDYDPQKEKPLFDQFNKCVAEVGTAEITSLYNNYINDFNKPLNGKLCFVAAMYNKTGNMSYITAVTKLIQDHKELLLGTKPRLDNIKEIIASKIFKGSDYHNLCSYIVKLANSYPASDNANLALLSMLTVIRKDTSCDIKKDKISFVNYIILCRNVFKAKGDADLLVKKILPIIDKSGLPKKVTQVFFAEYVYKNAGTLKSHNISFVFGLPSDWRHFLGESKSKEISSELFWKEREKGYQELKNRLLEKDLEPYRKDTNLLIEDLYK